MTPDFLKHSAGTHLSEDDLNDVLIGLTTPEADRHLASCTHCSDQLNEFRATMGAFNKASLGWSEARSNSMPLDLPPRKFSLWGFGSLGSMAFSAMLAFVVALLLTVGIHERSTSVSNLASSSQPQQASAGTSRQEEIASDNAMLAAISSELYRPTPSPLEAYEPKTPSPHAASAQVRE